MKTSPKPTFPLKISMGLPLEITTIAPLTEMIIPANWIKFNFSLKRYDAKRAIKTGLLAIITEALPAWMILRPLKKKTLYENTPVIPRRIRGISCPFLTGGSRFSTLWVIKRRKIEAIANLRKAAEKGPTSFATTLPAMKVPPQKMAVTNSFIYMTTFLLSLISSKSLKISVAGQTTAH
jgi:hypothetical protein